MIGTAGASLGTWARKVTSNDSGPTLIADQNGSGRIQEWQLSGAVVAYIANDGTFTGGIGIDLGDDDRIDGGDGDDWTIAHVSLITAADAELANIIVGTSDHQGASTNALIISTTEDDTDVLMLVNDGGNSKEFLKADAANATLTLGWGMTTIILAPTGTDVILGTGEGNTTAATGMNLRAPDIITGGAGNVAGTDLTDRPGKGTGTGDVGRRIFELPIVAAAGDNLQTVTERLALDMIGSTTVLTMAAAQALSMDVTGVLTLNPSTSLVITANQGIGIGEVATGGAFINVGGLNPDGASSEYGIIIDYVATASAITTNRGLWVRLQSVNSVFTTVDGVAIEIVSSAKGANNTITNLYGIRIAAQTEGGTTNYGLYFSGTSTTGDIGGVSDVTFGANIDLQNNTLVQVGNAGSQLLADAWTMTSANTQILSLTTTGAAASTYINTTIPAAGTGATYLRFIQGAGNGDADNQKYTIHYEGNLGLFRLDSQSVGPVSTAGVIIEIADDTNDVKFAGGISTDGLAAPIAGALFGGIVTVGDTFGINTGIVDDDYFELGAVDNDTNTITALMRFQGAVNPYVRLTNGLYLVEQAAALDDVATLAQIWVKNTTPQELWWTNEDGNDTHVATSDTDSGVMKITANQTVTIETANTPNAVKAFSTGLLENWTFVAGKTGAITAFSDGGSDTNIASATHGLSAGDFVTIRGAANYLGVHEVTVVDDVNTFTIAQAFAGNDGASDWEMGAYLTVDAGGEGDYDIEWDGSLSEGGAAGGLIFVRIYQDATELDLTRDRLFANNDIGAMSGGDHVAIVAGDRIWMAIESDGTNDMTLRFMNVRLNRI